MFILSFIYIRMASDLKIEIFAYNLFHNLWNIFKVTETLPNILEVYGDECSKVDDYTEALDNQFNSVIVLRRSLFRNLYRTDFTAEKAESLKSLLDCYDYVLTTCDRDDLFGHLTVFQRIFATITFVLIVGLRMHDNEHIIDIVKYAHTIWVMYFDKFTEEFYEKGGWKKLKIEAKSYEYLYTFDSEFDKTTFYIQKTKQATVNYFTFKNAVDCLEQKHKHPINISKKWIKFCIEHFESYINIPLRYEIFIAAYEAELLLEDLKIILDPSRRTSNNVEMPKEKHQGNTISTAISYSEPHNTSEEMKANDTGVQPLTFEKENRIIDKVPDKFSNIDSGYEKKVGKKCPFSEQEVLTPDVTSKNENLEFDQNTLTKMEFPKQNSCVDATKNFHIEQNLLPVVNRNKLSEISIKKLSIADDSARSCESFVNKCEDGVIENFCKGNVEQADKIGIAGQVISLHKMDKNTSPEKVPAIKDFSLVNENISSDDERKKTGNALEDLRNEQKDPEIKNFLKMLLVLDDKEGRKFILSTLQNNEGHSKNTSKPKKKSKKKKSGK